MNLYFKDRASIKILQNSFIKSEFIHKKETTKTVSFSVFNQ